MQAIIVTGDNTVLRALQRALQELSIDASPCADVPMALAELKQRRFDTFFLDCPIGSDRAMLVEAVRGSPSNQRAAIFAVIAALAEAGPAFRLGANFVLEKPVSTDRVLRMLRAAYGLLVQGHLTYFRLPIQVPVNLHHSGRRIQTTTVNLSRSGMAVKSSQLIPGTRLQLEFTLPDESAPLNSVGTLVWSDGQERSGIQFVQASTQTQQRLRQFLTSAFAAQNKPSVATGQSAA